LNAIDLIRAAESRLAPIYAGWDEIAYHNQAKVLKAMQYHQVRENYFDTSTGYGYGDLGRDKLENIYADVFGVEDAMVRSQIVSGTHAIAACLMALLKPGDEMISVLGKPYDTLGKVIGFTNPQPGTLIDRGIHYREIELDKEGRPDLTAIEAAVNDDTRLVLVQRSCGYRLRRALGLKDIEILVKTIRKINPATIIFLDNCYGEFTDYTEPTQVGIDLMAGSLIKNPGGGLAASGGYVVGHRDLVEAVSYQITAPGLGKALGASLVNKRSLYQGLFMAPHVVLQALKGAELLAFICGQFGLETLPGWGQPRGDIVQAVKMGQPEEVIRFCQIVQNSSPVDSDVRLEYGNVPGYSDQVVMAAGTFVQGSSIELSCDAPLREPYAAYFQGGLTYEHCRWVVKELLERLLIPQYKIREV